MSAKARAAVVGAVTIAAIAFTAALRKTPSAPAASARPTLRCDFSDAPELAWRLTVSIDSAPDEAPMEAGLRLRPLRAIEGGRWILSGRFDPRAHDARAADLRPRFAVRVAPSCQFEDFAWEPGTTLRQADAVRAALRAVEFHLPEGPRASWSSTHRDGNGSFIAWYRADGRGGRVEASAGDYLPGRREELGVHQQAWSLRAELDPRGHLASRVEGAARYLVGSASGAGAPLSLRVTLVRAAEASGEEPASELEGFAWRSPPPEEAPTAPPSNAAPDPLAAMTAEAACERLEALFDGDTDPAHDRAFRHLLAWLRARPDAAWELWSLLQRGRVAPRLRALVYMTLGEADAAPSRRALIAALRCAPDAMDRQRAAVALGTMRTPTPEALEALRAAARGGGRSDDDVISRGVAMRSIGAMAGDTVPAAVSGEARDTIREAIAGADPEVRLAGLDAAGNARTVALLSSVGTALADPRPRVRESAAHALRGLPSDVAQPLLVARLREETSTPVRRELARSIVECARGRVSPEAVDAAVRALPLTPEAPARADLLRLLGEASRVVPAARVALVAWIPREPEADLLRVIGSYLTVAEMRDALRHRSS